MDLLPNELKAKMFVELIGVDRAQRLLTAVTNRIERRVGKANKGMNPIFTALNIRKSPWEIDIVHKLKIGLILNCSDSPAAARKRNLERRALRKASSNTNNGV